MFAYRSHELCKTYLEHRDQPYLLYSLSSRLHHVGLLQTYELEIRKKNTNALKKFQCFMKNNTEVLNSCLIAAQTECDSNHPVAF